MADNIKPLTPDQEPLLRRNFVMMAIAGALIVVGFILMLGTRSGLDAFNDDIFSVRRIVVGPMFAFVGFVFMAVAIIWQPRKSQAVETPGSDK